jgi:hypothetical protein
MSDALILTDLLMPRLGETMEEGRIIAWLKSAGEEFKRGEAILEIETDKTLAEFPALTDGRMVDCLAEAGTMQDVGSVIAKIELPNTGEFAEIAELNYTYNVTDSDYDSATNRLFFTAYENIYSINLSTQRTVKIADFDNTDYISGLIFDESRQRLIVAQRLYIEAAPYSFTTISAYNLSTKVKTTISNAFVGSGAGLSIIDKMVLNTVNDTLFVFSGAQDDRKLIEVDVNPGSPTYGNRAIVSDNESPGVQLGYPEYPIYDEINNRILAGDLGKGSFNDISLANGNKDNIRLGPLAEKYIERIEPIFFNSISNRLVALAPGLGGLIEVDTKIGRAHV